MPPTDPTSSAPPPTATAANSAQRSGSTRANPLPLLILAGLLLLARIGFGMFERVERGPREDRVEWREPGREAETEATATGKPLLYDFSAEWCGPCHTMKDEIFADARMAAKINTLYVPVRVVDRTNEEGHNSAEVDTLQRRYRVDAFPTLVAASPDGVKHDIHRGYPGNVATSQWLLTAPLKVMGTVRVHVRGGGGAAPGATPSGK